MRKQLPKLALVALGMLGAFDATRAADKDVARTEAELKEVRREIDRIREQVTRDALRRDQLAKDLQSAEQTVGGVRAELDRLRAARAAAAAQRAQLTRQQQAQQRTLANERASLAAQIRAASLIGREEPLKLLLNQSDPALVGRMFTYYSYFGRARADQIAAIETQVAALAETGAALALEDERLAALEREQRTELARLKSARDERGKALASLTRESRSRERRLARLQRQQTGLDQLLQQLRRAMQRMDKFPTDSKDAFAKLQGKLAWPTGGRVVARYGETRAGGLKWDGMLLAGEAGAPVRAVYHGRIVYADWLPGLGLLTIIDHGDGYMSLYGHNQRLFKGVGERVTAGDTIATVGDTGGRARAELYFEIRKAGRPVDPRKWFSAPAPGR
ncbi:MAG TPA: peptidoglycan DD-metalloendopeptidase family protein [Steroidobacteraceae bacterium]|nr:peptidoglycan DD-metalloendopeptidase family protein [Steroidobacteraceae bacterium]HRX88899.1 peptidoglycan DD-metalloendopeptidase family protein [Steroidobacteraceae bacterium]